jgi:hypothetical protein
MGQRTLAFTKQMLRIFNLIELKEFDLLVAEAWPSIPWSLEMDHSLPERRRRPAHQKGRGNGVSHMTVDLLAAVRRGRRGCGEGIKGRCVLQAVSW